MIQIYTQTSIKQTFLCFVVFQAVLLFTNKLREHKLTFSYAIFAITSFGTKAYQAER